MDQLDPQNGVYQNSLFANATNTILGCPVILRDKHNNTYHGIFYTFLPDFDVILECCHKIDPSSETQIFDRSIPLKEKCRTRYFERENIVEMISYQVDKEFAAKNLENSFIDSSIAEKSRLSDQDSSCDEYRELVPYVFDSEFDSDNDSGLVSKEVSPLMSNSKSGWNVEDMLITNEVKFGYKSSYNPDLSEYTIPVEKKSCDDYKRREIQAEKLAQEIENSRSYRRNIDKELSDNEEEEYAFSAVIRTDTNNKSLRRHSRKSTRSTKQSKYYKH